MHRPLKKMFLDISSKVARGIGVECGCWVEAQRMTEAEHNQPIPKFYGNRPSAAEVLLKQSVSHS